jgi:uncharacterized integral membrane protein (TIGR00698 family)
MVKLLPGIIFAFIFAFISIFIGDISYIKANLHLNSLVIAVVIGFLIANLFKIPDSFLPGTTFTVKKILKLGIILIGFKISLADINSLGLKGLVVILLSVSFCFYFTMWLGKKMGIEKKLAILLAAGTSICGASAIIATGSVIKSDEKDSAISVAVISVIGTIFMVLYPVAFHTFGMGKLIYSVWAGSSIHEVAQVVAAGFSVSEEVGNYSSMVKMSRVTFIIPVTLILLFREIRQVNSEAKTISLKDLNIPWFVIGFVLMILLNSMAIIPDAIKTYIIQLDNILLTAAMFSLGTDINFSKVKETGLQPFYLCLASSIVISTVSLISTLFIYSGTP